MLERRRPGKQGAGLYESAAGDGSTNHGVSASCDAPGANNARRDVSSIAQWLTLRSPFEESCVSLFSDASRFIPGGVNSPVRAFRGVGGEPVFIERASGSRVFDTAGK